MGKDRINISAPNMVNVCIDGISGSGKRGRMYCCYEKEAFCFENELQLVRRMDNLMDRLNYPQSSVKSRSYHLKKKELPLPKPEKVSEGEEILKERGIQGTMILHVQYRQNATWQGRLIHVEKGEQFEFFSVLDLLKIIDSEF